MATLSQARKAAFQILLSVERGQSHSDELLRADAVNALSAPDRHLATALVLGVLRWQIPLDRQLQGLLKRPNAKLDPEIRIALRLGAFQLRFLDRIPARAAIDESVELAKQAGHRFASGMVNAVLRKLAAAQPQKESPADPAEASPNWMVKRWTNFFGTEATGAICRHGQSQPKVTARLAGDAVEAELAQAGIVLEPAELLAAARSVVSGDVTTTQAFLEGRVRIQDEGSQLVGELAAFVVSSGDSGTAPGQQKFLDACAAPGGKTLILAERNPTAHIVACESSAARFENLRKRLAALSDSVECRQGDATALVENAAFDLVLVDAPCSGTGTLGRNPEIRHRLQPDDFSRQAERQFDLLRAALRAVRPGGRVVYSTCSLEPEENEQVVARALAAMPFARPVALGDLIGALANRGILTPFGAERLLAGITGEGFLRLLPGAFPTDGFFLSVLERVDS